MTVTINLWHVILAYGIYFAIGLLSYLPLNILANRQVSQGTPTNRLWYGWKPFVAQVILWPLAVAEERGWL